MNRIVRMERRANEIVEIQRHATAVFEICLRDRIHMVNDQVRMNLTTFNSEVASVVSDNRIASQSSPCLRTVESLIDPTIESERFATDFASNRQVLESF